MLERWLSTHIDLNRTIVDTVRTTPDGVEHVQAIPHRLGDYFAAIRVLPDRGSDSHSLRIGFERRADAGRFWKDLMVNILEEIEASPQRPAVVSDSNPEPDEALVSDVTYLSHPCSQDVLKQALEKLAGDTSIVDRLVWWSQHAHSSERWLQFELAYRLEQELRPQYAVGCERGFVDIVVYDGANLPDPLRKRKPLAGVELKWYANWWFKDRAAGLLQDVTKTAKCDFPAMALGIWFFAEPDANCSSRYSWIPKQVKGIGVQSAEDVRVILRGELGRDPDVDVDAVCSAPVGFARMLLLAIGYFNAAARVR